MGWLYVHYNVIKIINVIIMIINKLNRAGWITIMEYTSGAALAQGIAQVSLKIATVIIIILFIIIYYFIMPNVTSF